MFLAGPSLREDRRLRIILIAAVIVQLIICWTSVGIYHPDQHFQIVEFSSYQLNRPSAATHVWELSARIRPTLQIYLFSGWYRFCTMLHLSDPYAQLTLLRLLFGMACFVFFNGITVYFLKQESDRNALYGGLLLLNFSWLLPYTRTLYSSEILSSLLFFGGILYYDYARRHPEKRMSQLAPFLTGLLFGMAFYTRFQMAFSLLGFLGWMLWQEKVYKKLWPMGLGFLLALGINVLLDYGFYHVWVFTPVEYFRVNLIEGKAATMGTSSFLVYIGELACVVLAPPLSLALLYSGFRSAILEKLRHPLFLSVVCFIIGHCLIAHKEERFLFPILNVLPIIVGWGLPSLIGWYRSQTGMRKGLLKGVLRFSVVVNLLLLTVSLLVPYSQPLYFSWKLKKTFDNQPVTIYTVGRSPYETDAGLSFDFYRNGTRNMSWKILSKYDSIRFVKDQATYVTATYNHIEGNTAFLEKLGYQRCYTSSPLLWQINDWLHAAHINTINDIWVLYKRKD